MPDPTFPYANGTTSTQGAGALINPYAGNTIQNPYGPSVATRVNFDFWRQPVYQLADGTYFTPGCDGNPYGAKPWDTVHLGVLASPDRQYTPGIAKVRVEKFRDVDKKKSAGADGARITIHGVEPSEVEIELTLWTPEQYRRLKSLWAKLFPPAYKDAPPTISAEHPTLGLHSIRALTFVKMEGPDVQSDGRAVFKLKAWEFLPTSTSQKPATSTSAAPLPTYYDQATGSNVSTPGSSSSNTGP